MWNCEECSEPFIPHRANSKFCSYDCGQRWHQRQNRAIRQWWMQLPEEERQKKLDEQRENAA